MKFYLRSKKSSGMAALYVRIQKKKQNVLLNTNLKVDIEKWVKANSSTSNWQKFVQTKYGFELNERLNMITDAINYCTRKNIFDIQKIQACIDDVVFAPIRKAEEATKEEAAAKALAEITERNKNPLYILDNFIAGIQDGSIRNKSDRYTKGTVKNWKSFRANFSGFYEQVPFTWDDVNKELCDKFVSYLEGIGYMAKTINKSILHMKALMNYALSIGAHDNIRMTASMYTVRVTDTKCKTEVYLTSDEVQALYDMKLEGDEDLCRDVFLVGVYTCQRFSDYSTLREENFGKTAKGTSVVRISEQQKTKNSVVIPILNNNLLAIARKYNFDIPKITNVFLNVKIKKVLERLSQSVESLATEYPTTLSMFERKCESDGSKKYKYDRNGRPLKQKWDMVASHTARRTGITLLYLTGMFDTLQMMSVSGHKDVKAFKAYIRLSKDEMADMIAKKIEDEASSVDGLF